jgi:hypothetical protein
MLQQQPEPFRRLHETADHRAEVQIGKRQAVTEESRLSGQRFQRREHSRCGRKPLPDLCGVADPTGAGAEHGVGEDLPHQRPVGVGVDDRDDVVRVIAPVS